MTQLELPTRLELATLKRQWIEDAIAFFDRNKHGINSPFSADEFRPCFPPPPKSNWQGCLFAALRCTGRIKEAGRVRSIRPERNGAKITLWEVV